MKANWKQIVVFIFSACFAWEASAESFKIPLGWGNITPCSRTVWRNDGVFGTPSPTVEWADQRVDAYATIEAPSVAGIQNDVQQCAVQGATAAGLASIISSPGGAMPAFQAQFQSCMESRAMSYFSIGLEVSEGKCAW